MCTYANSHPFLFSSLSVFLHPPPHTHASLSSSSPLPSLSQSSGGRQKKPKNQSGRAPAPPIPSPIDSNRALYQPLQRMSSNPTGNETYAGLNPATMEAPPLPTSRATGTGGGAPGGGGAAGGIRGDFYMQLNPQTRTNAESQQYMGLKDVRT